MNIEDELEFATRLIRLETKLEEISTNHLPHLQKQAEDNGKKSDKILWWVIATLVTLVFTLLGLIIHGALTYFQIK